MIKRGQQDHLYMQKATTKLCEWENTWFMSFNIGKCKVMHLGENNPRYQYTMDEVPISLTEQDVGVLIHRSLKLRKQCAQAAA